MLEHLQYLLGRFDLRLENPAGLGLLLVWPIFLLLGLGLGGWLGPLRSLAVQLLRGALLVCLAVALAQPVSLRPSRAPAVALLADLSPSVSPAGRERMRAFVDRLWAERGEAPTWLVGFGRRPRLLAGPGQRRIELPPAEGPEGSDPSAGLRLARALLPPDHAGRVVLLSDGLETHGDLLAEADRAREAGVRLFAVPLGEQVEFDARIERLGHAATARPGERLEVEVELVSSAPRLARLSLRVDGRPAGQAQARLGAGRTRVKLEAQVTAPGWHGLEVRLEAPGDRFPENDRAHGRVFVIGRPRVLLVEGRPGAEPLARALEGLEVELVRAGPAGLPAELAGLDLVVLDDLELAALPAEEVGRLATAVEEHGTGLLVAVGPRGAALADPAPAPIEALLPVEFRPVELVEEARSALVFVLDRSASMATGGAFGLLLRAVLDSLARLEGSVQVAVIVFDDDPEVVVPLTAARRRREIERAVLGVRVGGGTSIYPALDAARRLLEGGAAPDRHVILLSDGQSISQFANQGRVVERLVAAGARITAVALGGEADLAELGRIATAGGGRLHLAARPADLPRIFQVETERLVETRALEEPVRAVVEKRVQALAGLEFEAAPPLLAYVSSRPRQSAEVLLATSDRREPLLSRWRYGLGRVTVWSADAHGPWAAAWPDWSGFAPLWRQLVTDALRPSPPGGLELRVREQAGRAVLGLRAPDDPEAGAPALWVLQPGPGAAERPLALERRDPGWYRAELALEHPGAYGFRAERTGPDGVRQAVYASTGRGYPEEYLAVGVDRARLEEAARRAGGGLDPEPAEVLAPGGQARERSVPRWRPFVWLALGLFCLELLVRRL